MDDRAQVTGGADLATGLVKLSGLIRGVYGRVSQRHDLTSVQARLLCVLLDGPRGMAELAAGLGVEKAALTGLVDRAERRSLVQRSPVPGDRRAIQVTLTAEGRRAADAFHTELNTELARVTAMLAPEDREHFCASMTTILRQFAADGPPEGQCSQATPFPSRSRS